MNAKPHAANHRPPDSLVVTRDSLCYTEEEKSENEKMDGKRKNLGSIPLRLSFLFKSCGLWTLSCDFVPHN